MGSSVNEALEEVIVGLKRRASDCLKLHDEQGADVNRARLLGKQMAYDHAAELVEEALRRGQANEQGSAHILTPQQYEDWKVGK